MGNFLGLLSDPRFQRLLTVGLTGALGGRRPDAALQQLLQVQQFEEELRARREQERRFREETELERERNALARQQAELQRKLSLRQLAKDVVQNSVASGEFLTPERIKQELSSLGLEDVVTEGELKGFINLELKKIKKEDLESVNAELRIRLLRSELDEKAFERATNAILSNPGLSKEQFDRLAGQETPPELYESARSAAVEAQDLKKINRELALSLVRQRSLVGLPGGGTGVLQVSPEGEVRGVKTLVPGREPEQDDRVSQLARILMIANPGLAPEQALQLAAQTLAQQARVPGFEQEKPIDAQKAQDIAKAIFGNLFDRLQPKEREENLRAIQTYPPDIIPMVDPKNRSRIVPFDELQASAGRRTTIQKVKQVADAAGIPLEEAVRRFQAEGIIIEGDITEVAPVEEKEPLPEDIPLLGPTIKGLEPVVRGTQESLEKILSTLGRIAEALEKERRRKH